LERGRELSNTHEGEVVQPVTTCDHLPDDEMKALWEQFVHGEAPADLARVGRLILGSWHRCRSAGVNPYQKAVLRVISREELQRRLHDNGELVSIARPIMDELHAFVRGSGFMVALADKDGILLEVIGDPDVISSAARGNFVPGADWSEGSAGTNAVGTCLIEEKPLQVYAYEHFCICSHKWTCSAAPIRDPSGKIIGVLDMTGTRERVHPHTLGMVVAAANAISAQMRLRTAWQSCELSNAHKAAIIESIDEGIIAADSHGVITLVSNRAATLLGCQPQTLIGKAADLALAGIPRLAQLFAGRKQETDCEVSRTSAGGTSVRFIVTTRSVVLPGGKYGGMVARLSESARARRLATQMAGAFAKFRFEDIVGEDPAMKHAIGRAMLAAEGDATVLILGESGTGKELVAQAVHNASARRSGPFVAINCGAIPRELVASELFGYEEGAFTGARRGGNPGKFELADGGTIFLDEVGEMPLEMQPTLLRVLEERRVSRIGGSPVVPVDVRVIAATSKDLAAEARKGRFRADLFYRLNVLPIHLPPLRERKRDIPLLAMHFAKRMATKYGRRVPTFDSQALEVLQSYSWPGNVRELQNVIERIVAFSDAELITVDMLPAEIRGQGEMRRRADPLSESESEVLARLLRENQGNVSRVAAALGVARSTVYRKMAQCGLKPHLRQRG
jgi:PAS domain S-box-containing protein